MTNRTIEEMKMVLCYGSDCLWAEPTPPWRRRFVRFLRDRSGRPVPRVTLLATASGNNPERIHYFRMDWERTCEPYFVDLFGDVSTEEIRNTIMSSDLVYVTGGNTANMLAVWRVHGVDQMLKEAYENHTILAGTSAGALCWFEEGITDSFGPLAPIKNCLGILEGSYLPHGSDENRVKLCRNLVEADALADGIVQHDLSDLLFIEGQIAGCHGMKKNVHSFFVRKTQNGVVTERIPNMPMSF